MKITFVLLAAIIGGFAVSAQEYMLLGSPQVNARATSSSGLRGGGDVQEIHTQVQNGPASWDGTGDAEVTGGLEKIQDSPNHIEFGKDETGPEEWEDPEEGFNDLEKCFLLDDGHVLYDSYGNVTSRIPVAVAKYENGLFIQNIDEEFCGTNHNWPCRKMDSFVNCTVCIYDRSKFAKSPYKDEVDQKIVPNCRPEVSAVAKKCEFEECFWGLPIAFNEKLALDDDANQSGRKLGLSKDINFHSMAAWITTIGRTIIDFYDPKLRDFVLPGSHNSAAIDMDGRFRCGRWESDLAINANQVSKCQEVSLRQQLNDGIRLLDIRVVDGILKWRLLSIPTKRWRFPLHHTFLIKDEVDTMEKALLEICDFVADYDEEFVVIRFQARGTDTCEDILEVESSGGWEGEFDRLKQVGNCRNRLETFSKDHLDKNWSELKGKVYGDIGGGNHHEEYHGGKGVDGDDGDPYEIARLIMQGGYKAYSDKFNMWSFFPAPTGSELANTGANFIHDGLEDWDANFQKNVWLIKSLIQYRGDNVHGILRDRATTRKNIARVATDLTLERIFSKVVPLWGPIFDEIVPTWWVNEFDEKFEMSCGRGFVIQGLSSWHDDDKEDRLWKMKCRAAHLWVDTDQWWWNTYERIWIASRPHDSIWFKHTGLSLLNDWDGVLESGSVYCYKGYALAGLGSLHDDNKEDRRWWTKFAKVKPEYRGTGYCRWTPYINDWDGWMDYQVGLYDYISKVYSYHDDVREDRRWKLCVCTAESPGWPVPPHPTSSPTISSRNGHCTWQSQCNFWCHESPTNCEVNCGGTWSSSYSLCSWQADFSDMPCYDSPSSCSYCGGTWCSF